MKIRLLGTLLTLGFTLRAPAAPPESQPVARAPGEEVAGVSYLATGRVDFDDPENTELSGRVALQEAALSVPLAQTEFETITLAAGAWAGWTRLDFRNHPALDSEDLYGIAALLAASQPAPDTGWGWSAMALPGFYSDFRSGRTGEGKIFVYATVDYAFSAAWRAQLGGAYDTAFGDPAAYPVGGVVWQATDTLAVRLLLPSPSVYWAPAANWGLFAFAQPAGDRWIIDDDNNGEQEFLIEGWRAGLGAEYRVWQDVWLRASAGTEFERRYEVLDNGRRLLDDEVGETAFLSIAAVLY